MRIILPVLLAIAGPAQAQETTVYTYDALGRVAEASVSGGAASGTKTAIAYDKAGNRETYQVTGYQGPTGQPSGGNGGSSAGGQNNGGGSGAAIPLPMFIVVPLNGFTLIQVTR